MRGLSPPLASSFSQREISKIWTACVDLVARHFTPWGWLGFTSHISKRIFTLATFKFWLVPDAPPTGPLSPWQQNKTLDFTKSVRCVALFLFHQRWHSSDYDLHSFSHHSCPSQRISFMVSGCTGHVGQSTSMLLWWVRPPLQASSPHCDVGCTEPSTVHLQPL